MDDRILSSPNGSFFSRFDPRLTAFLRGLVLAIASAALIFTTQALTSADVSPELQLLVPFILLILRSAEGFIDAAATQRYPE